MNGKRSVNTRRAARSGEAPERPSERKSFSPVTSLEEPQMPAQITADRLTTLFRPRSVALVGASDKSVFSMIAHGNLGQFGLADRTSLVDRRGAVTHGQPTVRSCAEISETV